MGKSSSVTIGYRQYLGVEARLCFGAIDAFKMFRVKEKLAYTGSAPGGSSITISKPNLLGGKEQEGGVGGTIHIQDGSPSQTANSALSSIYTGALIPAGRAFSRLVFADFWWGNVPYLPTWEATVQRILKTGYQAGAQWYPEKAAIAGATLSELDETYQPGQTVGDGQDLLAWPGYASAGNLTLYNDEGAGDTITVRTTTLLDGGFTVDASTQGYFVDCKVGAGSRAVAFKVDLSDVTPEGAMIDINTEMLVPASDSRNQKIVVLDQDDNVLDSISTNGGANAHDWADYNLSTGPIPAGVTGLRIAIQPSAGYVREISVAVVGSNTVADMNPAHIIRELLTDPVIGRGVPVAQIDDVAFTAAADALYAEGFGISLKHFPAQMTPEDTIGRVSDVVGLVHYVRRDTGLHSITLIRDDYDPGSIPSYTSADVKDGAVERELAEELPNTISLVWFDWEKPGPTSITEPNSAKVQADGFLNETSFDAREITKGDLAARVLTRELRTGTTPKLRGHVMLRRVADILHPGDVISVTEPRFGLSGEALRVLEVNEGASTSLPIRVDFVEDTFGLPVSGVVEPDSRPTTPTNPEAATTRVIQEAPYFFLVQAAGDTSVNDEIESNNAIGFFHAAAKAPNGRHRFARVFADDDADTEFDEVGRTDFTFAPALTGALDADPETTSLSVDSDVGFDLVDIGSLWQIDDEIVRLDAIDGLDLTIGRGCLDTVPAAHTSGVPIYLLTGYAEVQEPDYNDGETIDVKLQTVTGSDALELSADVASSVTFDRRAFRPYPPGKMQIDGDYLPLFVVDGTDLTWAQRNRVTQTAATVLDFTDGDEPHESATTYRLEMIGLDGAGAELAAAHVSKTVTSPYTLTHTEMTTGAPSGSEKIRIKLTSVRDAFDSWQSPLIDVIAPDTTINDETDAPLLDEAGDPILQE